MLFETGYPTGLLTNSDHLSASEHLAQLAAQSHANGGSLGQEYLMADSGALTAVGAASGGGGAKTTTTVHTVVTTPAPTLVGSSSGLQFDLVWDSSVAGAPSGFQAAVVAAAQYYTTLYSNRELITIHIGFGEVNGSAMGSGALGESESYGYLTNYATVDAALQKDSSSSAYQLSADATLPATSPVGNSQFFVTSADAKALGLVSATSGSLDGYIGLTNSYSLDYQTYVAGNTIGSNQYDAFGIAAHEISEVMGRLGSVGEAIGNHLYTPLDLFRYTSSGVRDITPATGYFSINGGQTNLGTYNNPLSGADATDWGASIVGDSYGFGFAGHKALVSSTDIVENAVLGYRLTAAGLAATKVLNVA